MAEKMGILGRKLGMTRIFGDDGASVAVTVIQAGPCPVTQVKTEEKDGYNALQIAFSEAKEKHVSKAMQGHFAKAGTGLYSALREIRLAGAPEQKAGDTLTCELFKTGDVVKVTGKSIGKGYQGRMRRWEDGWPVGRRNRHPAQRRGGRRASRGQRHHRQGRRARTQERPCAHPQAVA